MAKSNKKKQLHSRLKHAALKGLAATSVKQGYLISKEEAIKTKWFEESYLDDEVWTSSWDTIIKGLKSLHPETANLKPKPKPKPKAAPKIEKEGTGGENGKSI
tara:strand:+ start:139 stop:447 length:309 start_codon:yes stop_codon:yes gene_type:complete